MALGAHWCGMRVGCRTPNPISPLARRKAERADGRSSLDAGAVLESPWKSGVSFRGALPVNSVSGGDSPLIMAREMKTSACYKSFYGCSRSRFARRVGI